MLNNQEYITTQLEKVLYEILPVTSIIALWAIIRVVSRKKIKSNTTE
ncbi:hypothetical protein BCD70_005288 [Clostridium beijerinckii]|nr:hypothetical protein [Clostridium beijerinckii]